MGFTAAGISTSTVTTTQQAPLGFKLTVSDGDAGTQEWTYVLADEAFVIGDIAVVNTTGLEADAGFHAIVSNGGEGKVMVLGVAQHVIASGSYGFVQSGGQATYVKGDGSVAAGELVVPDAAGVADTFADGEAELVFGYALAADAANSGATGHSVPVFAAMLDCGTK